MKLNWCMLGPDCLFDLESEKFEKDKLAYDPNFEAGIQKISKMSDPCCDLGFFDQEIHSSHRVAASSISVLRKVSYYPCDQQPLQKAFERYMRNDMNLNGPKYLKEVSAQ